MKITKTQLRQIIKEESAKVLNEYQFYPGTEDDMAAMKNQEREDSRKARLASDERTGQNKMQNQGLEDGKSLGPPMQSDNESYMEGYLAGRSRSLEELINQKEKGKKQYTGFKAASVTSLTPGTDTNKEMRNLLGNISKAKKELKAIKSGSWTKEFSK
tara:strand:- start:286 stop:759 length:474 start_codon:yes stop_codon:yes gene_type:complete